MILTLCIKSTYKMQYKCTPVGKLNSEIFSLLPRTQPAPHSGCLVPLYLSESQNLKPGHKLIFCGSFVWNKICCDDKMTFQQRYVGYTNSTVFISHPWIISSQMLAKDHVPPSCWHQKNSRYELETVYKNCTQYCLHSITYNWVWHWHAWASCGT